MIGFKNNSAAGGIASPTSNQYNQNNITFTNVNGDYFGIASAPRTGTLTFDFTDAVTGGIAVVYYNNATLELPTRWLTIGTFVPNEINKIYLERDSEGLITCNIISIAVINLLPSPVTSLVLTEESFGADIPAGVTSLVLTEQTF